MLGDEVGAGDTIAIQKNHQIALGCSHGQIARRSCPKPVIGLPQVVNRHSGLVGHLADEISGGVRRPVIRNQNFKRGLSLGQQGVQHQTQGLRSVVSGDHHGDLHVVSAGLRSFKYISLR